MKVWIPNCGDAIILDRDWEFVLKHEARNADFYDAVTGNEKGAVYKKYGWGRIPDVPVIMPKGTELVTDRIYIRQDKDDFASVTFMIKTHSNERFIGERFWAKLEEVNEILATPTSTGNPVGGFAKAKYKAAVKEKNDPSFTKKREERKRQKSELDNARMAIVNAVSEFKFQDHVTKILDQAIAYIKIDHAKYSAPLAFNEATERQSVKNGMVWGLRKVGDRWACRATRKTEAGTERDFTLSMSNFGSKERPIAGFTVLSHGPDVVSVKELECSTNP